MSSVVRAKVERSLWAVPVSFAMLFARATSALTRLPSGPELLYLSDQALRMGLCAAALMCALAYLDDRLRGSRSWIPFAGLLVLSAPGGLRAAHYFAHTDTLVKRGGSGLGSASLVLGLLAVLTFLVSHYQRQVSHTKRTHAFAGVVLAALIVFDTIQGFSQSGMVPFCYGAAALILTVLLGSVLAHRPRFSFRLAVALSVVVGCIGIAGLALPAHTARARADLHRTLSSLSHLDMFLTRAEGPSLLETMSATQRGRCDMRTFEANALSLPPEARRNVIIISIDSVRADDAFGTHGGRLVEREARALANQLGVTA